MVRPEPKQGPHGVVRGMFEADCGVGECAAAWRIVRVPDLRRTTKAVRLHEQSWVAGRGKIAFAPRQNGYLRL